MRLARLAMIVSLVLIGTASAQAQIAHSPGCGACGTAACQGRDTCCDTGCDTGCCDAASGCNTCTSGTCSGGGVLCGISAKLHHAVGGLFGGNHGHDARHKIYRAALRRSTFDKKVLLPIPYYSHTLPCYRHDRCCCGPNVPVAGCQHCGPHGTVVEEVIEMHDVPHAQPTPAVVPTKEARDRQWIEHSVSRSPQQTKRVAQQPKSRGMSLRNFIGLPEKSKSSEPEVIQVSTTRKLTPKPANALR